MIEAVLSLGSNAGDRLAHLQAAVTGLRAAGTLRVSPVFQTAPWGGVEQADYLNAVAVLHTALTPLELLEVAQQAEQDRERVRRQRWGPRTLDVDLVDVPGVHLATARLSLPHPRASERAFVLLPWLALDPGAVLAGVAVGTLAAALSVQERAGVTPRPDLALV